MMRQMELFNGDILGNISSCKERKREVALKRIFRQAGNQEKTLTILSVHGSIAFNTRLTDSAPEFATVTRLLKGVKDFRSKPRFDLVFYSVPESVDDKTTGLLENLCYSRMLLRPGAFLFLVTEGNRLQGVEVSWLRQAGFMKITTHKKKNGLVYFGGQRPLQNF